jgi:thymidylate synthase
MAWKSIVTELLWFLRGDTNIKFLVDNGCHIWDGDAYKRYYTYFDKLGEGIPHTKEEFIDKIKTDEDFEDTWGDLGPIYGKQWRSWGGVIRIGAEFDTETYVPTKFEDKRVTDQIANLINELKTNPDSRRLMVSAWAVHDLSNMVLPPCHYGFQMYTRELSAKERTALASKGSTRLYDMIKEGNYETIDADVEMHKICDEVNIPTRAISLMFNMRSIDTVLGLPFNIASYGLLLEIIAKEVNMVPEELIGNLGDVHLYSNHIEQAKEQISRTPYELPKLNINSEWWDKPFIEAVMSDNFCKCLIEEDIQLYDYQSHPSIKAPLSN